MKFISDNCIREIKVPVGKITCFDYSSKLNLIVSFHYNDSQNADVWNPDTGEVLVLPYAIGVDERVPYVLFLPEGRYIAVAWNEDFNGSGIDIYPIDYEEEDIELGAVNKLNYGDCMALALTPENNILAGAGFYEFKMDYKNMKFLEKRLIFPGNSDMPDIMDMCMCCSRSTFCSYIILYVLFYVSDEVDCSEGIMCVNVEFSSSGEAQTSEELIKHCFIDGEKIDFKDNVIGLAHDGENVIISTRDQIITLESATDGSVGHVIVSSAGKLKLNDKGQLMVCNGSDVISVYQYKDGNTLQGLCRLTINNILKQRKDKVADLPLPNSIKNYLSYKV